MTGPSRRRARAAAALAAAAALGAALASSGPIGFLALSAVLLLAFAVLNAG